MKMIPQNVRSPALVIVAVLLTLLSAVAQPVKRDIKNNENYPVPAEDPDMLFYLQRSLDLNSVIYAANYLTDTKGHRKLDIDKPVEIYWLLNDKMGSTKPLSKVQRLGYGFRSEEPENEIVTLKLVAYRDVPILLKPAPKENRYLAHIALAGKDILLSRIFINIDGGTKLKPNVTFIELSGTEVLTGKKLVHRITP